MYTMIKKLVFTSYLTAVVLLVFSGCEPSSGTKGANLAKYVMRVNCGAIDPYTDKAGNEWLPDQYMDETEKWGAVYGMTVDRSDLGITGTDAPRIYESECYSMDAYEFVVPNGKYTVRLHFAETYEGITDPGMRVFSVAINGKTVLKDFDVYDTAGGPEKPVVKEYKGVKVTDGKLIIEFIPDIENPEINGIEIFSE
jgi:endoglucanase